MPFEISYDAEHECVVSVFTGKITMPLVREYIAAVVPVLEEHDCRRVLSDSREATLELSATDILTFPKLADESPITAQCRRAVLAPPKKSGYMMYEALSLIRGHKVRVFTDRDKAMEWLLNDRE